MIKIPQYLKKGDTIGLICPAGFMPIEKVQTCINTLQQWGYKVKIGKTVGSQFHYFSGSDEARLDDLQQMLNDATINAVLCARGGYGVSRIIDAIDFSKFKKNPKWIIGYSDITVLHAHINTRLKTASLHSPMAGAFNDEGNENEFVQSLRNAIAGKKAKYSCPVNPFNRNGKAEGELIGGNLSLIAHLIGSISSINTNNKILFLEDVGEYLYNIDRMLLQLKRAGMLENLAGLIIGGFTDMKDTAAPFGQNVFELIYDKIKDQNFPVCFNFPVSHTERNYALKIGLKHALTITNNKVSLKEIAS